MRHRINSTCVGVALTIAFCILILRDELSNQEAQANRSMHRPTISRNAKCLQTGVKKLRPGEPSWLIDYSACPYVKPGKVMPHYICNTQETREVLSAFYVESHCSGSGNLSVAVSDFVDAVRKKRVCLFGDSMVNQFYHSLECLLWSEDMIAERQVLKPFFSPKYKMELAGTTLVKLRSGGTITFNGVNGPCRSENHMKVLDKCSPNTTDILIFNVGYLHCSEIFGTLSFMRGENSTLNETSGSALVHTLLNSVASAFPRTKLILYGQPAGELVNVPMIKSLIKKESSHGFLRHPGDAIGEQVMQMEMKIARQLGFHYVPSYTLTRHPLSEARRVVLRRKVSIGRTDRVHFCLPGLVDFAAHFTMRLISSFTI